MLTNFEEDWQKTYPDIRNLKKLHKKFALILIVCQSWHESVKAKIGITFDLDVILICGFCWKSYFLKVFQLKNEIPCFFWSAVPL